VVRSTAECFAKPDLLTAKREARDPEFANDRRHRIRPCGSAR
jgi:hypothetical protein